MKELRKRAIQLSGATMTSLEFYMKMPVRDFVELYREVAEEWEATKH